MSWREGPAGPAEPTMQALLESELHLIVRCSPCRRELRLTPMEAIDALGADCTMIAARDRLRCSWCGARGRSAIEFWPCSIDRAAQHRVWHAERQFHLWKTPENLRELEDARAAWAVRRPRDMLESMCNAFRLKTPIAQIALDMQRLGLPLKFPGGATPNDWPEIEMTRPTNVLPVFRPVDPTAPATGMQLANMRWWLAPFFHRGEIKAWKAMCTNARAETVATSRTFKGAFERRRCLVPADAYYEWTGETGAKTRWRFERADGDWWSFAGLWDRAETAEGVLESFAIVTTAAGPDSRAIHDRQPVILEKDSCARWLDLSADVTRLLAPSPAGSLTCVQA